MVVLRNMLASVEKNTQTIYVCSILRNILCHQSLNYQGIKNTNIKNPLISCLIADNVLCFFLCQMNFQLLWEIFDNDVSIIATHQMKYKENCSVRVPRVYFNSREVNRLLN